MPCEDGILSCFDKIAQLLKCKCFSWEVGGYVYRYVIIFRYFRSEGGFDGRQQKRYVNWIAENCCVFVARSFFWIFIVREKVASNLKKIRYNLFFIKSIIKY